MSCEFAQYDGSYVLGSLSPVERQQFEQHLSGCRECARSVRELAGLPGLLARVEPQVVEGSADEEPLAQEPVPETLLPSLVHEVRRSRFRRMSLTVAAAAASIVAVVVASLAATGVLSGPNTPAAVGPTPSASVSTVQDMTPVVQGPVRARIAFESVAWGTQLHLACTYNAAYVNGQLPTYALVVHTRDGRSQQVATWRAVPGTMRLSAATAASRADIASVEVRTAAGQPVLRLTT